ncbi:MAG: type II toxin-antitoxin system Phd/YefM family antitoxin [Acidobacteria bacterium]|nr:type II toxin-antitoxin system Phd/YefM family antitoxin [Acidobacteriota bacterium]
MQAIRVSQNIISVSEFKRQAAEWLRRVREASEPLVITQNGRAAAVLLSPAAYDELTARYRFMTAVEEGLADAEAGRVSSHQDVIGEMRRRIGGADDE